MARRGLSSLIPGLIILFVLTTITALVTLRALSILELKVQGDSYRPQRYELIVERARYTEDPGGPSVEFTLANRGPRALEDLGRLEVIISYRVGGVGVVELLKFNATAASWSPGSWALSGVYIGSLSYTYQEHPYLKPGEVAVAVAYLSRAPDPGSPFTLVVVTPEGVKAEVSSAR